MTNLSLARYVKLLKVYQLLSRTLESEYIYSFVQDHLRGPAVYRPRANLAPLLLKINYMCGLD